MADRSLFTWISMIICTLLMGVYLWLVIKVFQMNEKYFSWLTYDWLMTNLEWVGAGMIVSLVILLFFPVILTLEFRKLSKKED